MQSWQTSWKKSKSRKLGQHAAEAFSGLFAGSWVAGGSGRDDLMAMAQYGAPLSTDLDCPAPVNGSDCTCCTHAVHAKPELRLKQPPASSRTTCRWSISMQHAVTVVLTCSASALCPSCLLGDHRRSAGLDRLESATAWAEEGCLHLFPVCRSTRRLTPWTRLGEPGLPSQTLFPELTTVFDRSDLPKCLGFSFALLLCGAAFPSSTGWLRARTQPFVSFRSIPFWQVRGLPQEHWTGDWRSCSACWTRRTAHCSKRTRYACKKSKPRMTWKPCRTTLALEASRTAIVSSTQGLCRQLHSQAELDLRATHCRCWRSSRAWPPSVQVLALTSACWWAVSWASARARC